MRAKHTQQRLERFEKTAKGSRVALASLTQASFGAWGWILPALLGDVN